MCKQSCGKFNFPATLTLLRIGKNPFRIPMPRQLLTGNAMNLINSYSHTGALWLKDANKNVGYCVTYTHSFADWVCVCASVCTCTCKWPETVLKCSLASDEATLVSFLLGAPLVKKHFNCQIALAYCCNSSADGQVFPAVPPQLVLLHLSLVFKATPADIVAFYGRRLAVFCSFPRTSKAGQNETINTEADSSLFFTPVFVFFSKFPRCCAGCLLFFAVVLALFLCPAVYKSAWPSALLEVGAFVPWNASFMAEWLGFIGLTFKLFLSCHSSVQVLQCVCVCLCMQKFKSQPSQQSSGNFLYIPAGAHGSYEQCTAARSYTSHVRRSDELKATTIANQLN